MHARVSAIAVWIMASLLAGGGAVAASSGYRHYAELARLQDTAEAEASSREQEMVALRRHMAVLQGARSLEREELRKTQRMLALTRSLLEDALTQAEQAKQGSRNLRQENTVLRQCLAGALQAIPLLGQGEGFQAVQIMMTVDGPCRAAQQALYMPAPAADR